MTALAKEEERAHLRLAPVGRKLLVFDFELTLTVGRVFGMEEALDERKMFA